jgi:hypothetical protein
MGELASEEVPLLLAAADAARVATAARLGVGVQLAERGPSAQLARSCVAPDRVIAASIHDRVGLARRVAEGVDLVLLAPFGEVPGKGAPRSDDEVRGITEASVVPVFALGAIRSRLEVDRALALGCASHARLVAMRDESSRRRAKCRSRLCDGLVRLPCPRRKQRQSAGIEPQFAELRQRLSPTNALVVHVGIAGVSRRLQPGLVDDGGERVSGDAEQRSRHSNALDLGKRRHPPEPGEP